MLKQNQIIMPKNVELVCEIIVKVKVWSFSESFINVEHLMMIKVML